MGKVLGETLGRKYCLHGRLEADGCQICKHLPRPKKVATPPPHVEEDPPGIGEIKPPPE